MSYFYTDDDGGTLWQSLDDDDPNPKPLISRRGSTTALWKLALRGAGLDPDTGEPLDTVAVPRTAVSTLLSVPLLAVLPEHTHDAVRQLSAAVYGSSEPPEDPWRWAGTCTCAAWSVGGYQHESYCGWIDEPEMTRLSDYTCALCGAHPIHLIEPCERHADRLTGYTITVSGCDDHTTVELELTETEAAAVAKVARQITAKSDYGCMPTMYVERWVNGERVECVPADEASEVTR